MKCEKPTDIVGVTITINFLLVDKYRYLFMNSITHHIRSLVAVYTSIQNDK